jgi:hypothetical protein
VSDDKPGLVDLLLSNEPVSMEITFTEKGGLLLTAFRGEACDPANIVGGFAGHKPLGQVLRLSLAMMVAPDRAPEVTARLQSLAAAEMQECRHCHLRKLGDEAWINGDKSGSTAHHDQARATPHTVGCPKGS